MLKRFLKDNSGIAAIELVMLAPIFIMMLLTGFEVGRYVMILNKMQSAGYTIANVIAQTWPATVLNACDDSRLTETTLSNITSGMNKLMEPFSQGDEESKVIVSSIQKNPDAAAGGLIMRWRHETGALGASQSEVTGTPGSTATITDGVVNTRLTSTLQPGENVLILESFYRYVPVFPAIFGKVSDTFTERTIVKRVYFYNRLGKAIYLPPTYPVDGEIQCQAAS